MSNEDNEAYNAGYIDGVSDERERIAQAIEARIDEGAGRRSFWRLGHTTAIREAARIARSGGNNAPSN